MVFFSTYCLGTQKVSGGVESFYFHKIIWQVQKRRHIITQLLVKRVPGLPGFPRPGLRFRSVLKSRRAQKRSAVHPDSFSLKVVPSGPTSAPTPRRQVPRKEDAPKGSRPAARKAHGAERASFSARAGTDRSGSVPSEGVPNTPQKAGEAPPAERGEAEFRYHFSLPKQFHSQCSLRYGDAAWCALLPGQRGPRAVQPRRPGPRSALPAQTRAALPPPPPPPVRATPATKGARRASSERGRRRLLPTPLRHSVMSGFPVCAWERTLPSLNPRERVSGERLPPALQVIRFPRRSAGARKNPVRHRGQKCVFSLR